MKRMTMVAAMAAVAFGAFAAEEEAEKEIAEGWSYEPGSGVSFDEQPIVSAEFGMDFDSKYLTYGFTDNNDPILSPSAGLTFFDWVQFKVKGIYDVTRYGHKCGWGSRQWKMEELDPSVRLIHEFSPEDYEWLPTKVSFEFGYMYEYHPRAMGGAATGWADTQFVWTEIGLPDLWLEPDLYLERDIDRDNGTYACLTIGHTFPLVDGENEDDDPVLSFCPSFGQGIGNTSRMAGYCLRDDGTPLRHGGLMDSTLRCDLTWAINDYVELSFYVAYVDFWFDRSIRESARRYESSGRWDESYNFIGGLSLLVSF